MAIIALIVTPLVMTIIRKARIAADKRSIDAYGRSIEYAIASYLLDNGRFPTDISDLTIEHSGNEVICSTTQLNSDSSVYLTGCRVAGRTIDYAYGSDLTSPAPTVYAVGDTVSYNNTNYYVIADSGANEESVTLLKAEPLTVDEVNTYGAGHVNRYTSSSVGTAFDVNKSGYGGMAFYTSETCGSVNGSFISDGCTTDYAQSEAKYVVDAWKTAQVPLALEARLITFDELINNLDCTSIKCSINTWLKGTISYWTQSPSYDHEIWTIDDEGFLSGYTGVHNQSVGVRPVIVLPKSAL